MFFGGGVEEANIDPAWGSSPSKPARRSAGSGGTNDEVTALIAAGAANPTSPTAVALADAWRRSGRADEAVRVAREALQHQPASVSARVVLALSLLDLGRPGEARGELARAFEVSPERALARAALERAESARRRGPPEALHAAPPAAAQPLELLEEIGGDEFDRAFEAAEAEEEGVVDAHQVAEQAIRSVEQGVSEDLVSAPSPFATATMAGLLERQGHAAEARAVRERAATRPDDSKRARDPAQLAPSDAKARDRARILATFERWLENLRRGGA
ncbi:MAG TPA: tetratricopeptide repeat protein [Myxococcota bacterium]|nr:tetratricopeptide repeat protein [Myxococcota bacterium]